MPEDLTQNAGESVVGRLHVFNKRSGLGRLSLNPLPPIIDQSISNLWIVRKIGRARVDRFERKKGELAGISARVLRHDVNDVQRRVQLIDDDVKQSEKKDVIVDLIFSPPLDRSHLFPAATSMGVKYAGDALMKSMRGP